MEASDLSNQNKISERNGENKKYLPKTLNKQTSSKKGIISKIKEYFEKFIERPFPEKIWVLRHPFKAKRAWEIALQARSMAEKMATDTDLDGDTNGGQVDAFRHAFWMVLLTREFGSKTALSLGKAHEKSNKIYYKQSKNEDGTLPDRVSCDMDLKNNETGTRIARKYPKATETEIIKIIKKAIVDGELWIIKKDANGRFLDWEGKLIEKEEYKGKWYNPKCLVPSDYTRKNESE